MTKPDEKSELTLVRIFDAPPAIVFEAWTDPRYVSRWWGPKGFTAPHCRIDLRVGGSFLFCMRSPDGKDYWNTGVYHEIVVPRKIVSAMYFSDKQGNRRSPADYGFAADFPAEMIDIVTFEPHGQGQTKLTLRRNHPLSLAKRYGEDQGWNESLDRLAVAISAGPIQAGSKS